MSIITIGQIIDRSLERYREHFKELFGISLWILVAFIPLAVSGLIGPAQGEVISTSRAILLGFLNTGSALVITVVSLWVGISLILAIDQAERGKSIDVKALSKQAWKLFFPFALLSAVVALLVSSIALLAAPGFLFMVIGTLGGYDLLGSIGFLLFAVGAVAAIVLIIKFSIELIFTQYSFILNTKGKPLSWPAMKSALKDSRALVHGRWFATLLRIGIPSLIFSLVVFGANYLISLGGGVLLAMSAGSLPDIAIKIGVVLLSLFVVATNALAMPLYSIATYILYDSLSGTSSRS
ncbi:MAG: hypothetical protein UY72_C0080G0005 [Candidatus Uhrbacteria bacterium GW2011_GWD2_52_7]|uniref:Glycerophosphoryl diester phosphodiesterase membrane domain-containing protein n=1 Tax=Candidatus Uhrbacteria bacterium GW2011_GWD2_52_7 TaxID=1618989 RepID=A0A0G1ZJN5_9BACT|nr:MAG: hypothetical protein UY72_C0080G0005 [Candidatus Uhrbacteria bacterium GW2011_GWD2_52_7]